MSEPEPLSGYWTTLYITESIWTALVRLRRASWTIFSDTVRRNWIEEPVNSHALDSIDNAVDSSYMANR